MKLEKLKESPSQKFLFVITISTFIPFIILTIVFITNEIELISSTGYGLLDFELSWNPDRVQRIFSAWGHVVMQHQIFIHYIDYIYIIFYSLFGAEFVLIISRKLEGRLQKFGLYLIFATIIAGIFDSFENINLLLMLNDISLLTPITPFFASLCAVLKIGFIIISLSFIYITNFLFIFKKISIKKEYQYIALLVGAIIIFGLISLWNLFIAISIGVTFLIMLLFIIHFNSKNPN